MAKRNTTSWQTWTVVILVLVMIVGLLGLDIFSSIGGSVKNNAASTASTRDLALSCTTDMATQFHIHPHIRIFINNKEQTIPGDTGITGTCLHPIHTHAEDADHTTIHVESPEQRDFTVGDFFAVWGKTFNQGQILDSKVDSTHEIVMTVNGVTNNDYDNYVMKDGDQIVIRYQAKSLVGNIELQTTGGGTVKVTPQ